MLSDDLIIGAKGAATYSGLSARQVYHLSAGGRLPVIKKGKRLYFRKSDLDAAFRADAAHG